jgi:hypothetical protein
MARLEMSKGRVRLHVRSIGEPAAGNAARAVQGDYVMRRAILVVTILLLMMGGECHAGLGIIGDAGFREYDPSNFPPDKKLSYKIMKARCTKCHTLDRVVQAIGTGIAPISWQPFDQNTAKAYGDGLMRKANESMTKDEVKFVVELMQWLITVEREKYLPRDDD